MTGFLAVTNWQRYQHYKDRSPTWIKLHVEMLHNEKLKALPLSTRLLWIEMLLLAANFQNAVPNSPELIGNLAGIPPEECREGIQLLLKGRWLREKKTRRSASSIASLEVRSKSKEKEGALAAQPAAAATPLRVVGRQCPECDCGGGVHSADCSRRVVGYGG
jgi:hypothetical protein